MRSAVRHSLSGNAPPIKKLTWLVAAAFSEPEFRPGWFLLPMAAYILSFINDTKIRADAFTEEFTVEKFAEILFSLMLSALVRQDFDPSTVLEIVRRAVY